MPVPHLGKQKRRRAGISSMAPFPETLLFTDHQGLDVAQGDGDQAQPATRHTLQGPPLVPQCGTVLAGLVFSGEGLQVCGGPEKAQQVCPLSHGSGPCQPRHIRRMGSSPCPPALCTSWQLAAGRPIGHTPIFPSACIL